MTSYRMNLALDVEISADKAQEKYGTSNPTEVVERALEYVRKQAAELAAEDDQITKCIVQMWHIG